MFFDLIQNEYFWISFFPISFLGIGLWFLFFERSRKVKDPLITFVMALMAGGLSTILLQFLAEYFGWTDKNLSVILEEVFKVICAIGVMEAFKQKFKTIAGGIVFGFAVGLGFAFMENLFYLEKVHEIYGFDPTFWLTFQGRFWGSTLLHGGTTAVFGLFYGSAYLSKTIFTHENESALTVLLAPFHITRFIQTLTFPVTRVIFKIKHGNPHLEKYVCRSILFEGFLVALGIHFIFNFLIIKGSPLLAFLLTFVIIGFLRWKMEQI